MDSRSFSRGIGVGQFIAIRDLSKEDILSFFEQQNKSDNCPDDCPFINECDKVYELSNHQESLCDILGVEY